MNHYDGQVNFKNSAHRTNWRIMTVIPTLQVTPITKDLEDEKILDHLDVDTEVTPSYGKMILTFGPRTMNQSCNTGARRKLLKYLARKKLSIIWKEDRHGYEISSSGHIRRKWELVKQPRPVPLLPMPQQCRQLALMPPFECQI